jgi:hypothetical protein
MKSVTATCAAALLATSLQVYAMPLQESSSLAPRADNNNTATVALSSNLGTPNHLASGFIYGLPDRPNQIPSQFYTGMGFRYGRAGGAQTPSKGWLAGFSQYTPRFQSALSNYHTAREYGARFQLLLHDMWGADGGEASNAPFPGDNGDWTRYVLCGGGVDRSTDLVLQLRPVSGAGHLGHQSQRDDRRPRH